MPDVLAKLGYLITGCGMPLWLSELASESLEIEFRGQNMAPSTAQTQRARQWYF